MSDTHRNSRQFRDRQALSASNLQQRKSLLDRQALTRTRLMVIWGGLALGALGLVARLVWLQVIDAPNLQQLARAQQSRIERPFVPRRSIVDRTGDQLAIDRPSYTL
ncbi:MAG: hypothetical protein HC778_08025 [Chamaesiphon sp. CSU_1_12]|nr:hypothetical protein [Chamaesiphon sp. CSU_1_12]